MIELYALGSAELRNSADGRRCGSILAQPKRFAILVYLALARPRGFHRRDVLLGLFWPEFDEKRGRAALRRALYFLRRSLGPSVLIGRWQEEVGFAQEAFRCDVDMFDCALEEGRLRDAMALYRGELLPGFHIDGTPGFERWLEGERARIRREARAAAWTVAEEVEADGGAVEAARWARRGLRLEPCDEEGASRLIRLLARHGDRTGAVRAYDRFELRLREELDMEPSPALRTLADSLRGACVDEDALDVRPVAADGLDAAGGAADELSVPSAEIIAAAATRVSDGLGPAGNGSTGEPAHLAGVGPPGDGSIPRARVTGGRKISAPPADARPESWESPDAARGSASAPRVARLARSTVRRALWIVPLVAALLTASALLIPGADLGRDRGADAPSVAVLPFNELGTAGPGNYLAGGITEDVMIALAHTPGLAVTSRVSAAQFGKTASSTREIAEELGVTHLVEGTVRRAGDRIRVSVRLIEASSDRHLWARNYHGRLTDLFAGHAAVAGAVARELGLELAGRPREKRGSAPTTSPEAYDFLLRGRDYLYDRSQLPGESVILAVRMLERALGRDSSLVEARALLARAHIYLYQWSAERDAEHLESARREVKAALTTDPESPWAHLARADLARAMGKAAVALEAYGAAEQRGLRTGEVAAAKAAVLRDLGRLEEAARLYEHARALDPRNEETIFQSHFVYLWSRRYEEAVEALDRVLELVPDHRSARRHRALIPLYRDGDAAAAGEARDAHWEVHWRLGDIDSALEKVQPPPHFPVPAGTEMLRTGLLLAARGDSSGARAAFDSARVVYELEARGDSLDFVLRELALAYAGLGRKDPALRAGARALEMARETGSRTRLSIARLQLAWTHVLLGDAEAAIEMLDAYLSSPGPFSFAYLATHPLARPLRDHPRFRELRRRHGPVRDSPPIADGPEPDGGA